MLDFPTAPPPAVALTAGRYLRLRRIAAGLTVPDVARALGRTAGQQANIRNNLIDLEQDQLTDPHNLVAQLRLLFSFDAEIYFTLVARAADPEAELPLPQICRGCGCSWHDACQDARFGPCAWLPNDPALCDACARKAGFLIMALAIVAMSATPIEFIGLKLGEDCHAA